MKRELGSRGKSMDTHLGGQEEDYVVSSQRLLQVPGHRQRRITKYKNGISINGGKEKKCYEWSREGKNVFCNVKD